MSSITGPASKLMLCFDDERPWLRENKNKEQMEIFRLKGKMCNRFLSNFSQRN
jgi:hypothetical protein